VTFKPTDGLENLQHEFWNTKGHDGSRATIVGDDLSSIAKGGFHHLI
jgi:hypothetical protein